jgi:hypothetical protein
MLPPLGFRFTATVRCLTNNYDDNKVEEKRENCSLRKLRKPGEREKYFVPHSEISHTKREKTFLCEN